MKRTANNEPMETLGLKHLSSLGLKLLEFLAAFQIAPPVYKKKTLIVIINMKCCLVYKIVPPCLTPSHILPASILTILQLLDRGSIATQSEELQPGLAGRSHALNTNCMPFLWGVFTAFDLEPFEVLSCK